MIVVGGGIAGLVAAREIVRRGRSVKLVEARERVGGRAQSRAIGGGGTLDFGAEFIGPTQDRIRVLVTQLGLRTFPVNGRGRNVYVADGGRATYGVSGADWIPPPDAFVGADLNAIVARLDQMSGDISVVSPSQASLAPSHDRETLDSWLRGVERPTGRFMSLSSVLTRAMVGAIPRDCSLLFSLFLIAATGEENNRGTLQRLFNTHGGPGVSRVEGGAQSIANRIARELGNRVLLGSPARRIVQSKRGVDIVCDAVSVSGQRAIIAIPPVLAGRLVYEPGLPVGIGQLIQRMPGTSLIKVQAVYRRPFWRMEGLSRRSLSLSGPCNIVFDSSPPESSRGVLSALVGGDASRDFRSMTASHRRGAALQSVAGSFGAEALQPIDYAESDWAGAVYSRAHHWVGGAGVLTEYGENLRQPFDRVHWAGTETSTYWNGYMDGAVRSGMRAATEALSDLKSNRLISTPSP